MEALIEGMIGETRQRALVRAGAEVEQLERALRHLEHDLAAVALGVAADLAAASRDRSGCSTFSQWKSSTPAGGVPPFQSVRRLARMRRHADGGEAELEAARRAQGVGEDAEAEAVVRHGAGSGDLHGPL